MDLVDLGSSGKLLDYRFDPTRRAILQRLSKGEARVTDVAQPFAMSLNAVSKHIRVLERARLVRRRRAGREHLLSVSPQPLDEAAAWIERQRAIWTARLDALDRELRAEADWSAEPIMRTEATDEYGQFTASGEMELRVGGRVELQFLHANLSPHPDPTPERYKEMEGGSISHGRITRCEHSTYVGGRMNPNFAGSRNIAVKVPPHTYEATVRFYRDVVGLKMLENHLPAVGFEFGGNQLWIDRAVGLSQAEIWLELVTDDVQAASMHLEQADVVRCDEIEPLPERHEGFWIADPASIILHVGSKRSQW